MALWRNLEESSYCDERGSNRKVEKRLVVGRTIVYNNVKFKFVNVIFVPPNTRTDSNEIAYVKVLRTRAILYCVVDWLLYRL